MEDITQSMRYMRPNEKIKKYVIGIPGQGREIGREVMFEEKMAKNFLKLMTCQ